jgi:hypothetical protein
VGTFLLPDELEHNRSCKEGEQVLANLAKKPILTTTGCSKAISLSIEKTLKKKI